MKSPAYLWFDGHVVSTYPAARRMGPLRGSFANFAQIVILGKVGDGNVKLSLNRPITQVHRLNRRG